MAHLTQVSGLDTNAGLRLCGGNWAIYRRALEAFAASYARGLPASPNGNLDLRARAHSIAGAGSVIGATDLAMMAQAIARSQEASADEAAAMMLDAELKRLAAAIQQALRVDRMDRIALASLPAKWSAAK
jgi:HPt (histidine-containing phosphotransfer) domain-containing protein